MNDEKFIAEFKRGAKDARDVGQECGTLTDAYRSGFRWQMAKNNVLFMWELAA